MCVLSHGMATARFDSVGPPCDGQIRTISHFEVCSCEARRIHTSQLWLVQRQQPHIYTAVAMKSKLRHYEHSTLVFTIICDTTSDPVDHGFGRHSWRSVRRPFTWEIVRPDRGSTLVAKACPYCGKELRLEVDSLESLRIGAALARKVGPVCAVLCLIGLAGFIAIFVTPESIQHNKLFSWCIWPCIICFLGSLVPLGVWLGGRRPGYNARPAGEGDLSLIGTHDWFNQHYVESVWSH
jgi:hypothetical protein